MVKTSLKNTYLGGTNTTAPQNEVSTWRKMYDNKETQVMVNQLVNEFYSWSLFKTYAILQDVVFPLYTAATFFNNLSTDIIEFLVL